MRDRFLSTLSTSNLSKSSDNGDNDNNDCQSAVELGPGEDVKIEREPI